MTPALLLLYGLVALLLLLAVGVLLCMFRSLDRHDRYRQANANRHLYIDSSRGML